MADLLLDSDVVIWHLRGRPAVVELVTRLADAHRLGISVIVRAEVLSGARASEVPATVAFLDACETLAADRLVADRAAELVRGHRPRDMTVALPDALIASTGLLHGIPLYTCNARHYAFEGLEVREVKP